MTAPIAAGAETRTATAVTAAKPSPGIGEKAKKVGTSKADSLFGGLADSKLGATGRRRARRARVAGRSPARKVLVAEFVVCAVILALSPLTDKHKSDPASALMKRGSAIAGLFLILGLVATGGQRAGKIAASFGGIVLVSLLVSDRDIFTVIAAKLAPGAGPAGPPGAVGGDSGNLNPNVNPQGADVPPIHGDPGPYIPGVPTVINPPAGEGLILHPPAGAG